MSSLITAFAGGNLFYGKFAHQVGRRKEGLGEGLLLEGTRK